MKKLLLVPILLLLGAAPAAAQPQWEIHPFGGYLFGGKLRGGEGNLVLQDSADLGIMLGIRLMPQVQLELGYARQETHADYEPLDGSPKGKLFDLGNNYLHAGVNYAIFQDKLTPFVSFGLGATHWNPQGVAVGGEWRFSAVMGGGAKYYFSDRFGVRAQLRIYSTFLTNQGDIFCDPFEGCVRAVESGSIMQVELGAGVVLGF